MNYPLRQNKFNWRLLTPETNNHSTEDYIAGHYDMYLTSEYIKDDEGEVHRYYRFHVNQPHTIEMALAYDISCPRCRGNMLKQVGRCQDHYKLGLYECPVCDRKK